MSAFGDWCFVREAGVGRLEGPGGLVLAASAGPAGSGLAGVDTLGVPDAAAPAGMRVQHLRLRFRSQGFFSAASGAHVALGLTGAWRKTDPNAAAWNGLLAGRGAILGNVSGAPNGCPRWPVIQLESFRLHGNALFPAAASVTLQEDTWYALHLRADLDGAIAATLRDAQALVLSELQAQDDSADVPRDRGGWWITHVFGDADAQATWRLEFADIALDWTA